MSGSTSLLEKERNRDYLVWSHTKLVFLGGFVEGDNKQVIVGGRRILDAVQCAVRTADRRDCAAVAAPPASEVNSRWAKIE